MGWNAWNSIRCEGLNEALIREVADAMVSSGLKDAGYNHVNIDDCWMATKRSEDGHLRPHPQRFPSGMKVLGDYIHSKGLKFGIYSCAGHTTCEGHPASFGYEKIDAQDWADWGVDYLKYDFCGLERVPPDKKRPKELYQTMRDALNATGRPIVYSLCNWGTGGPHLWGQETGNSWRTGRDVFAVWDEHAARKVLKLPGYLQSVMTAIEDLAEHHPYAGPGGFNDPDMLVVGLDGMTPYGIIESDERCPTHLPPGTCKKGDYISREVWGKVGGLTHTEQRTHFAFWCMLAAPLMLGNDPRHMSAATKRLLTAPELLAINQDPLAKQARRIWRDGALAIWHKPLASGDDALLLFNGGDVTTDITTRWGRDLPDVSRAHEREVPRDPPCADKPDVVTLCSGWAKGGECVKNAGYMKAQCPLSCDACPPAKFSGPQATARVRNAWEQDDEGEFIAMYTAKHVEPHEARLLVVSFGEKRRASLVALQQPRPQQAQLPTQQQQPTQPTQTTQQQQASRSGRRLRHVLPSTRPHSGQQTDEKPDAAAVARSHRHSVHEQHMHEVKPLTLGGCAYEYGASVLSLYMASVALAAMGFTVVRALGVGTARPAASPQKRNTGSVKARGL